ncbi:MAG: sugar nucleotide-binding protein [Propionibacteriaceae bacterium]
MSSSSAGVGAEVRDLAVAATEIPGLLVVDLPVRGDNRGWFKENWQRAKMTGLGLPDFGPVQNNVSFNASAGATRGIHAEPWDKYVSIATGRIFGVWVDLREGPDFGTVVTLEMGPDRAVFVPSGVGNAFQVLQDGTAYSYLVNDHWSPAATARYTFVNLADPTLAIGWPIDLADAELSEADRNHPTLDAVAPVPPRGIAILGANGQLGRALQAALPAAVAYGRDVADLADPASLAALPWGRFHTVVNAAAYTAVDQAETAQGRRDAWAVNVTAVAELVRLARAHRVTLVHVSSDYVFDGDPPDGRESWSEDDAPCPLGVYGQTKAAADALVGTLDAHYLVRTSWVVGEGKNFVATMASLADRGISPQVIDDQVGRLTFTADLAGAIVHLLGSGAPYGTYNLSCGGPAGSWADLAAAVFAARGRSGDDVVRVSTATYAQGKDLAPRPACSVLALDKVMATGWRLVDGPEALRRYVDRIARS